MTDSRDLFGGVVTILVLLAAGNWLLRITWSHRDTLRFQLRLFTIALLVRFLASVAIYEFGFWAMLGDADASGWWFGQVLGLQWRASNYNLLDVLWSWSGAFQYLGTGASAELGRATHVGYYYLLGTVFFMIGTSSRMIAAAINCFIGALIVVFAYRTARALFSEWVAVRVGWWTCLFPSMIIWSSQTVKEPVVILLEIVALYGCIRLRRTGFALRYVLLCGFAIAAVVPFRFYAAYISLGAIGMVLLAPGSDNKRLNRASSIGMLAFLATLAVLALTLANNEIKFNQFDIDFIQRFRHDIAEGTGSGVDLDVDMRTTTGFSVGTLVGAAHLLFAPFPWQLGGASLRMLLTTPELVYWWWLIFVGIIPGLRYALRTRAAEMAPILVFLVGLGLLYSMTFGNVGVVFRQRAQLLPWLLMFAGVGLEQRARALAARSVRRAPALARLPLPANGRG